MITPESLGIVYIMFYLKDESKVGYVCVCVSILVLISSTLLDNSIPWGQKDF